MTKRVFFARLPMQFVAVSENLGNEVIIGYRSEEICKVTKILVSANLFEMGLLESLGVLFIFDGNYSGP